MNGKPPGKAAEEEKTEAKAESPSQPADKQQGDAEKTEAVENTEVQEEVANVDQEPATTEVVAEQLGDLDLNAPTDEKAADPAIEEEVSHDVEIDEDSTSEEDDGGGEWISASPCDPHRVP